jgi:hypothetical protein
MVYRNMLLVKRPNMHILRCVQRKTSWVLKVNMLKMKMSSWTCLGKNQWFNKLPMGLILSENVNLCSLLWYFIFQIKGNWWRTLKAWKIFPISSNAQHPTKTLVWFFWVEYGKVYEWCGFIIHPCGNAKCLVHHCELWQSHNYRLPKLDKYACVCGGRVETNPNFTMFVVSCEWHFCR